jgi:subtilisin family serine protease
MFRNLACAAILLAALSPALRAQSNAVPNELLVQFRPGVNAAEKARALGRGNATAVEVVSAQAKRRDGRGDLTLVRLSANANANAARQLIGADNAVNFVEPNFIYNHHATSNDTYVTNGTLWGMLSTPANAFGSQATTAWANDKTDCSTVYVGIIDEGYMYTHTDLAANAGVNPGEIPNNNIDDDGNGYVDDVYGWDFDGNNKTIFDGTGDDHGTHVAGTIGGVGGNGTGVAGVCWSVKLLSGKFLGNRGGTTANAIKAVNYFTDLKRRQGLNIVATNNSWGGGGFSQALKNAIDDAGTADILFVAAAGNSGLNIESSPSYPASYTSENIISVAAITINGQLASFSNYGSNSVDLGAPGVSIMSTVPVKSGKNVVSGYASYNGTSMATPHVTGAVALYAAAHPGASAATIKAAITASVTFTSSLNAKTKTNGRLNVSTF